MKSPRHTSIETFLLNADWEGGAPEIWEKDRTAGPREQRGRQELCPEQEPEIAWSCLGGMENESRFLSKPHQDSSLNPRISVECIYSIHRYLLNALTQPTDIC